MHIIQKTSDVPPTCVVCQQVIEKSNGLCGLCGQPVDLALKGPDPASASVDHIDPISLGGSDTLDNVQLAHFWCNSSKCNRVALISHPVF